MRARVAQECGPQQAVRGGKQRERATDIGGVGWSGKRGRTGVVALICGALLLAATRAAEEGARTQEPGTPRPGTRPSPPASSPRPGHHSPEERGQGRGHQRCPQSDGRQGQVDRGQGGGRQGHGGRRVDNRRRRHLDARLPPRRRHHVQGPRDRQGLRGSHLRGGVLVHHAHPKNTFIGNFRPEDGSTVGVGMPFSIRFTRASPTRPTSRRPSPSRPSRPSTSAATGSATTASTSGPRTTGRPAPRSPSA